MIEAAPIAQQLATRPASETLSGGRLAQRGNDLIDHFLDQQAIVALAHHADHGFGAGRAHKQPAVAVEPLLAGIDRGLDVRIVERLAGAIAHGLQNLRQRVEAAADFRYRAAKLLHDRQHLERSDEAVAGGGIVRQDNMARRLAAEIVTTRQHPLEHVALANRRTKEFDALAFEETFETEIRHHGRNDAGLGEPAILFPALRDHGEELIAVDQMAALIDQDHTIGIAVERNADIDAQFAHLAAQRFRRRGAAFLVDVEAVGFDADGDDVGAELPQRFGRHLVGGAVGAIDNDTQAFEAKLARQRALGEFDVAVMHAVDAAGTAEACALRQTTIERFVEQLLDLLLDVIGQLEALRPEQLDAV